MKKRIRIMGRSIRRVRPPLEEQLKFIMTEFVEQLGREIPKIEKARRAQKPFKVILDTEGERFFEISFFPAVVKITGLNGPK